MDNISKFIVRVVVNILSIPVLFFMFLIIIGIISDMRIFSLDSGYGLLLIGFAIVIITIVQTILFINKFLNEFDYLQMTANSTITSIVTGLVILIIYWILKPGEGFLPELDYVPHIFVTFISLVSILIIWATNPKRIGGVVRSTNVPTEKPSYTFTIKDNSCIVTEAPAGMVTNEDTYSTVIKDNYTGTVKTEDTNGTTTTGPILDEKEKLNIFKFILRVSINAFFIFVLIIAYYNIMSDLNIYKFGLLFYLILPTIIFIPIILYVNDKINQLRSIEIRPNTVFMSVVVSLIVLMIYWNIKSTQGSTIPEFDIISKAYTSFCILIGILFFWAIDYYKNRKEMD